MEIRERARNLIQIMIVLYWAIQIWIIIDAFLFLNAPHELYSIDMFRKNTNFWYVNHGANFSVGPSTLTISIWYSVGFLHGLLNVFKPTTSAFSKGTWSLIMWVEFSSLIFAYVLTREFSWRSQHTYVEFNLPLFILLYIMMTLGYSLLQLLIFGLLTELKHPYFLSGIGKRGILLFLIISCTLFMFLSLILLLNLGYDD